MPTSLLNAFLCTPPHNVLKSYFSSKGQPTSLPCLTGAGLPAPSVLCPEHFVHDSRLTLAPYLYSDSYLHVLDRLRALSVDLCLFLLPLSWNVLERSLFVYS